jgi:hypothetical protein
MINALLTTAAPTTAVMFKAGLTLVAEMTAVMINALLTPAAPTIVANSGPELDLFAGLLWPMRDLGAVPTASIASLVLPEDSTHPDPEDAMNGDAR